MLYDRQYSCKVLFHSDSESVDSSEETNSSLLGLQHFSSAIHKQASVRARLLDLHKQFRVHPEFVHLHLVNSVIPGGAGLFVVSAGTGSRLSNFHPVASGEGIT